MLASVVLVGILFLPTKVIGFLGGGGGAADVGNGDGTWDGNNAGNGGGIVILSAPTIHGLNGQIQHVGFSNANDQ